MRSTVGIRVPFIVSSVLAATLIAACSGSSGGGSAPSKSQVESKLKTESDFKELATATGKNAVIGNKLISCVAEALEKDADPSSLQDYVDGKVKAENIKFKAGSSQSDAKSDFETCGKSVLKQSGSGG